MLKNKKQQQQNKNIYPHLHVFKYIHEKFQVFLELEYNQIIIQT